MWGLTQRALRVRQEMFEDHGITTVDQIIHALFNLEGVEREGAHRAVLTTRWLNGEL